MGARGMRLPVVLLAGAGAALLVSGAQAKRHPATVHPTATVAAAHVAAGKLSFIVDVAFPIPAHAGASACSGKVTLAQKVKAHHKAPHWRAKLSAADGACVAAIHGTLPAKLLDRTVAFKLSFPGNARVASFAGTRSLKLSAPAVQPVGGTGTPVTPPPGAGSTPPAPAPPPPPPSTDTTPAPPADAPDTRANGHWFAQMDPAPSDPDMSTNADMQVVDGVIQPFISNNNFELKDCHEPGSQTKVDLVHRFRTQKTIPVIGGAFSGAEDQVIDHNTSPTGAGETLHLSVQGTVDPDHNTGQVTFEMHGTLWQQDAVNPNVIHEFDDCHGTGVGTMSRVP